MERRGVRLYVIRTPDPESRSGDANTPCAILRKEERGWDLFYTIIERERFSFKGGLCADDGNPDDWHSTEAHEIRRAKKVCQGCQIRIECLEYALRNDERFGVWGGMTDRERGVIHKTRF